MTRCFWGVLLVLAVLAQASSVQAEIPWKSKVYNHFAAEEPLDELLRQFGADQEVSVITSERVQGTISGEFKNKSPQQFLEQVTSANGLIWYYDGHAIYIYRADEVQTRLFTLVNVTPAKVKEVVKRLNFSGTRTAFKLLDDEGLVYVVGPPRFVELISNTIALIETVAASKIGIELESRVYPLKYAWADDQTITFIDSQVQIPGVATILRNLHMPQEAGAQGAQSTPALNTLNKLKGTGLIQQTLNNPNRQNRGSETFGPTNAPIVPPGGGAGGANNIGSPPGPPGLPGSQGQQGPPGGSNGTQLPVPGAFIQPDDRMNAVVIRDIKENHEAYAKLIEQLDRPTGLVQIAATIVDIDKNYNFELGPPYNFQFTDKADDLFQVQMGIVPVDQANFITTVARSGVTRFLASMRALEAAGHANIVSQPTVLTINNTEAMLSDQQTFFVRVAGAREVDLFNVSVGVVLKVTPHIIDDPEGRKIKLNVKIEDGSMGAERVDDIPVIRRSTINTQAVLQEEESLLIGGLFHEEERQTDRGLPVLGRIKYVGRLFRVTVNERIRLERVVLMTPRIIELSYNSNKPLPAIPSDLTPCLPCVPQPFEYTLKGCDPAVYPNEKFDFKSFLFHNAPPPDFSDPFEAKMYPADLPVPGSELPVEGEPVEVDPNALPQLDGGHPNGVEEMGPPSGPPGAGPVLTPIEPAPNQPAPGEPRQNPPAPLQKVLPPKVLPPNVLPPPPIDGSEPIGMRTSQQPLLGSAAQRRSRTRAPSVAEPVPSASIKRPAPAAVSKPRIEQAAASEELPPRSTSSQPKIMKTSGMKVEPNSARVRTPPVQVEAKRDIISRQTAEKSTGDSWVAKSPKSRTGGQVQPIGDPEGDELPIPERGSSTSKEKSDAKVKAKAPAKPAAKSSAATSAIKTTSNKPIALPPRW